MLKPDHPNEVTARLKSFTYAFAGIKYVVRNEHNAWIHAFVSVVICAMAWWLQLPRRDWAVLVVMLTLVWMAECINTAVEAVVDLASPERHPLAKIAKDAAAGGVLIAAIGSVIVGLLILGPPLWLKLGF